MPSDEVKVDIAYKKFSKKQYTSTNKRWHEEFPGKAMNIRFQEVWVDPIPSTPPLTTTSVVEVIENLVLTEDVTVDNHLSWLVCSTPGDLGTRIGNFIQPDQDVPQAYYVKLYDNTGQQIYVGDPVNWEFDYANGVLTFEFEPTEYTSPFKISAYRYVGAVGSLDTIASTLDSAYDGTTGSGAGKVIEVDFGPVTLNASNGSAALQITPVGYTPSADLADGQIINRAGILYVYDNTRSKWLSMQRHNIIFGAKRADGIYLNVGDFSSNMSGWPALRDGVILGITAQASGGFSTKEFKILKNDNPTPLLTFSLFDHSYSNGNLNISFDSGDLIKILASSENGVSKQAIITLETAWRVE